MDFVAAAAQFNSCHHGVCFVVCSRAKDLCDGNLMKWTLALDLGLQVVVVKVVFCSLARGNSQIVLLLLSR